MSKSKRVKNKGHGKSKHVCQSLSFKGPKRVPALNNIQEGQTDVMAIPESPKQNQELTAPFAIDDTVLVLWDDGSEGVCHYIPRKDLRITDRSKILTHGTKVTYMFKNTEWSGRIPASTSELIVCCCLKNAVVDIRCESKRQVLVLWDNPLAGACHYMYTKDLRIIDDSHRIERGTRVAFRTKRPIDWTGQVPPAIYDANEKNSINVKLDRSRSNNMKGFQKLMRNWFPPELTEVQSENSQIAVIDKFWGHIDRYCRNVGKEDLEYIESRIRNYHRRNRIRSKIFARRQDHLVKESERVEQTDNWRTSSLLLDVVGRESSISEEVSDRSSLSNQLRPMNGLKVNVNETESSPPSCNSLGSSLPESTTAIEATGQSRPETDSCSEEGLENGCMEAEHVLGPRIDGDGRNSSAFRMNSEHLLERLSGSGQSDLLVAADAMMGKYAAQFSVVRPEVEDFLTSDESLTVDSEVGSFESDEVIATIRQKQAELLAIESKNLAALQKIFVLMKQSMGRQEIEERLSKVDHRIAELTASLTKYLRLKYKAKPRFKLQYVKDREEARLALEERRRILAELNAFDSKCSETCVNLCGQ